MQILRQDIRYGARMLAKKPAFSIVAVITLALGIGANTAIFSVVNAVLLRSLPYHNPDRLVVLSTTDSGGERDVLSIPEAQEFQARAGSLEDLTAFQTQSVNLTGGERPDRLLDRFQPPSADLHRAAQRRGRAAADPLRRRAWSLEPGGIV